MPLNKDLREFLGLLNSNEVEYLVVGVAMRLAFRALLQFGFGSVRIEAADLQTPGMVSFDDAWATRSAANLEGVPTQFTGRATLLCNKESTGRAKDLGAAEELRKRGPKAE